MSPRHSASTISSPVHSHRRPRLPLRARLNGLPVIGRLLLRSQTDLCSPHQWKLASRASVNSVTAWSDVKGSSRTPKMTKTIGLGALALEPSAVPRTGIGTGTGALVVAAEAGLRR